MHKSFSVGKKVRLKLDIDDDGIILYSKCTVNDLQPQHDVASTKIAMPNNCIVAHWKSVVLQWLTGFFCPLYKQTYEENEITMFDYYIFTV